MFGKDNKDLKEIRRNLIIAFGLLILNSAMLIIYLLRGLNG